MEIRVAALFYGRIRRRDVVEIDAGLRQSTEAATRRFHELIESRETPLVYRAPKCRSCSMLEVCMPPRKRRVRSVASYLSRAIVECTE